MSAAQPLTGREAACRAVTAALTGDGFVVEALAELRKTGRLEPREAAFAREIALGAVRHAVTIDHVLAALARYDRRRIKPALRALLYTAAYQIIWMERVPPFAAVDQAVCLAHDIAKRHAAGMVNALLRRVADGIATRRVPWQPNDPRLIRTDWANACAFEQPVFPTPGDSNESAVFLAAATGERESRFRELLDHFGCDGAEQFAK
ncbi:MAG: transcription antitermination protein NusB, partial [Planctomycetes bacterium]|nr:transcription antitermination protein NusB [Planctomycetota bacterium]